jgi:hypothetical protein
LRRLSVERQIFFYPHLVGSVGHFSFCELALTLGILRLQQVAVAGMAAQHFPGRSHFKTFGDRLPCFASCNRFWHWEPGMYLRDLDWQQQFFRRTRDGLRAVRVLGPYAAKNGNLVLVFII